MGTSVRSTPVVLRVRSIVTSLRNANGTVVAEPSAPASTEAPSKPTRPHAASSRSTAIPRTLHCTLLLAAANHRKPLWMSRRWGSRRARARLLHSRAGHRRDAELREHREHVEVVTRFDD